MKIEKRLKMNRSHQVSALRCLHQFLASLDREILQILILSLVDLFMILKKMAWDISGDMSSKHVSKQDQRQEDQ
jgi:hypothetical protein